eukprot:scaffold156338_cov115-Cyclotella_meneghiniana.AAC.4
MTHHRDACPTRVGQSAQQAAQLARLPRPKNARSENPSLGKSLSWKIPNNTMMWTWTMDDGALLTTMLTSEHQLSL